MGFIAAATQSTATPTPCGATHPDFRYSEIGAAETVQDSAGRLRWVSGRPGEAPAYAGTDFIVVRDGRIAALYLFFDGAPDQAAP